MSSDYAPSSPALSTTSSDTREARVSFGGLQLKRIQTRADLGTSPESGEMGNVKPSTSTTESPKNHLIVPGTEVVTSPTTSRRSSDFVLATFMESWHADNARAGSGRYLEDDQSHSVPTRSSTASPNGSLPSHEPSSPSSLSAVPLTRVPSNLLTHSPSSPEPYDHFRIWDTSSRSVERRLATLLQDTGFAYAIYWRSDDAARAAASAAIAATSSDRAIANAAASAAQPRDARVPQVLQSGGVCAASFASPGVELYLDLARHCSGFSLGLGVVGRVAWCGRPEWVDDISRAPVTVFPADRRRVASDAGLRTIAVVPSGRGVVEVGSPTERAREPWVVALCEKCLLGF